MLKINVAVIGLLALAGCMAVGDDEESNEATSAGLSGNTYYVRTDGGDATQCTGVADAPYPGSGTGKACAWKSPSIALPASGARRIAGGDTLFIGSGSYELGSGGVMQPIPSGASATARTRFLGKPGAPPPKLVGVGGTHRVLNLEGSSNVEVGNLEITDKSDCVYGHSDATARCATGGGWSRTGLYASSSRNVSLHDLNIHGMAARAIQAAGLTDWTIERVRLNRNGTAGWSGDIGTSAPNAGKIVMRDIEIGWNGCGERVATGEPWACWAQQTGGYGDGLGTTETGGDWLVEDAFIHHNTSDGLDLRYMDGADSTHVTLRRVHSVANAGNQVKVKGNLLIENSVMVGQCTFFKDKYFMAEGDLCRAYGSTLLLILTGNDVAVVRHNTLAGEGDAQIAYGEGSSSDKIFIQNNVVVGFPYYASSGSNTLFSGGSNPGSKSFTGNLAWNVRNCPSGNVCNTQDPKLKNMALATFDATPLAGSPVIDKAPMISEVTTDFVKGKRPAGPANDIGAYEFGATPDPGAPPAPPPPPPSGDPCARNAPTVTVSGPTGAATAGSTVTYTVSVRNNDGSCYTGKTFFFGNTVPAGWTGSLAQSSSYINSGATFTTTLSVTSPAGVADGSYPVGVSTSSAIATHTASAASTYSVGDSQSVPCIRKPATVTVSGAGTAAAGGTVTYTVSVRNNDGSCYTGKTFSFESTVPSGWTGTFAQSSSYINAGTTFTTTLSVKSATSTKAGTYDIGVSTSTSLPVHAAATSTTATVTGP